jgi:hypothetical protein
MSPSGIITGIPTASGTGSFNVQATDATGAIATKVLSITINRTNVALAANGGVATVSSFFDSRFNPRNLVNGDRTGVNFTTGGGGWHDATVSQFPDWAQVTFSGQKSINEIDVYTVQDNYVTPLEPTPVMFFTQYGPTAFDMQYWDGTKWWWECDEGLGVRD